MKTPQLIVLTPVFNEAWILHAFLRATSIWADHIIIADQMSTDGSRDIYPQYEKVIVVDNPRKEMHQAATRRLLFEEAKKIEGDKILFTLDADEFLSGDFMHTKGWQTIMNSEPGDVFEFRWMNLSADVSKYSTWQHYYWAAHVDEELLNGQFPDNFIHEWRLPWPKHVNHEYKIDDISFVHFARANALRQCNKERFYQISQSAPMGKYSGVRFYRQYHPVLEETFYEVPMDIYACYEANGIDVVEMLNLQDEGKHYTDAVLRKIEEKGIEYFKKLDVWEHGFLKNNNLQDPRTWWDKMIHTYLRATNKYQKTFLIHIIDKVLKKIY